ncbi:MAG: hypothetical protein AAF567_05925 [Actinomycetota bacterium]
MGTLEILIVFAALMAVIALVAIAIDWVGRPLKTRRFIPRIYRYDDELGAEPVGAPSSMAPVAMMPGMHAAMSAPATAAPAMSAPMVVATVPASLAPAPPAPTTAAASTSAATTAAAPRLPSRPKRSAGPPSAFQSESAPEPTAEFEGAPRRRGIAETIPEAAATAWHPGMPLDARAGDAKPTAAVKAERFWQALEAQVGDGSHFDEANRERMRAGRAAVRRNPRTGEPEAVELHGLRAASTVGDVRMTWPGEDIDPWSST